MRSITLIAFLLVLFISSGFGAVSTGFYHDPRYPGKCTISDELILPPGETVKDHNLDCARIICKASGMVEFQTCGVEGAPAGCEVGDYVDKSLPYPECCKREIICN